MQVPCKRPLFQEGVWMLRDTSFIWGLGLTRMGQSIGLPQPCLWDDASGAFLPAPQPCPLPPVSPLQAGSVLSTQPLLRSHLLHSDHVFSVPTLADGPPPWPELRSTEINSGQTASLAMPYRHTSMQTHTRSPHPPHPPPPFAFVVWSLELVQVPELSLLLPTDHPLGTCSRWLFMVGAFVRYSINEWMNKCMFFPIL